MIFGILGVIEKSITSNESSEAAIGWAQKNYLILFFIPYLPRQSEKNNKSF